jgi:hypothetical protein
MKQRRERGGLSAAGLSSLIVASIATAVMLIGCGARQQAAAPAAQQTLVAPPASAVKPIAIPVPTLPAGMPQSQKDQIMAGIQAQQQAANEQRQELFAAAARRHPQ